MRTMILIAVLFTGVLGQDAPDPDGHSDAFDWHWAVNDFIDHSKQAKTIRSMILLHSLITRSEWEFDPIYPDVYRIDYYKDGFTFKDALLVQFVAKFTNKSWADTRVEVDGGTWTAFKVKDCTVVRKAISMIYVRNTDGKYRLYDVAIVPELVNKFAKQSFLEYSQEVEPFGGGSISTDQ